MGEIGYQILIIEFMGIWHIYGRIRCENIKPYNTPQKLDSCLRCKMSIS